MTHTGFEIVLDTETTGLNPADGHRLVEIACVELQHHRPTGRVFQCYINPQRDVPEGAKAVHGLDESFLSQFPCFKDSVPSFLDFIGTTPLVIHNADFDLKFINYELQRCGYASLTQTKEQGVIDTLQMARAKYRGSPASLDALCRRFKIPSRDIHGALVDAEILARVYLALLADVPTPSLYDEIPLSLLTPLQPTLSSLTSPESVVLQRIHTLTVSDHEQQCHFNDVIQGIPDSLWKTYFPTQP